MGDIPTTDNKAADTGRDVVKGLVGVAVVVGKLAAIAEAPWLKLPGISFLFNFIVGKIQTAVEDALAEYVVFAVIDHQVNSEKTSYDEAAKKLQDAHAAGDEDAINKAKQDFKNSLGKLIHWDGSSPIH